MVTDERDREIRTLKFLIKRLAEKAMNGERPPLRLLLALRRGEYAEAARMIRVDEI